MPRVFVAVGSNIRPEENVHRAIRTMGSWLGPLRASTFYVTKPVGTRRQPAFYNGVVEGWTDVPPLRLKWQVLRSIEARLGRARTNDRGAPRTIDLDLLLYGDLVSSASALVLPDPDIPHRPFLALPLHELAPDLVLPGSGLRLEEVAARADPAGLKPLREFTRFVRGAASVTTPVPHR